MRRVLVAVVPAASALVFALATSTSAPAARTDRVNCQAKALTFLFWPRGHSAVASVGFPAFPYPHMEVYKTDPAYQGTNQVALVEVLPDGRALGGFAKTCPAVGSKPTTANAARAQMNDQTALTCTFPRAAHLEFTTTATPSITIKALLPGVKIIKKRHRKVKKATLSTEVSATFGMQSGSLQYDSKYCKTTPSPQ